MKKSEKFIENYFIFKNNNYEKLLDEIVELMSNKNFKTLNNIFEQLEKNYIENCIKNLQNTMCLISITEPLNNEIQARIIFIKKLKIRIKF